MPSLGLTSTHSQLITNTHKSVPKPQRPLKLGAVLQNLCKYCIPNCDQQKTYKPQTSTFDKSIQYDVTNLSNINVLSNNNHCIIQV